MEEYKRIYIIGQSGTGKTTFAKKLSDKLGYPHIELDVYWHKYKGNRDVFKEEVLRVIPSTSWIVEGKHQTVREYVMGIADLIIFLDFPLSQSVLNNLKRAVKKEEPGLSFLRHLIKVIKEFYPARKSLKNELKPHQNKLIILKSFQEVDDYLWEVI